MMVIVSYDVATSSLGGTGRLRKVAKICEDYGQRAQNSVFECLVDSAQLLTLKHMIKQVINEKEDSIRYYNLGSNWHNKIEHVGTKKIIDIDGPIVL